MGITESTELNTELREMPKCAILLLGLFFFFTCTSGGSAPITPELTTACNVTTQSKSRFSITARWPKADGDPGKLFKYSVYYSTSPNMDTVAQIYGFGTISLDSKADTYAWEVTGLTPLTIYYINVIVKGTSETAVAYCRLQEQTFP